VISTDLTYAGCTPESGLLTVNTQNFILIAGAGLTFAGGVNSTILNGDVASYPLATDLVGNSKVILNGVNYLNGSVAQTAKGDVLAAYATAASKQPRLAIIADLGGTTVTAGIHEAPSSIMNSGTLTLDGQGDAAASFVFIAASTLTTATSSQIVLVNGAQPCHVFWLVGSSATLGTSSVFVGTVIAQISISLLTGANATGRFLCDSAITMDSNVITRPGCTSSLALLANDCVGQQSTTSTLAPLTTLPQAGSPNVVATSQPTKSTPIGTIPTIVASAKNSFPNKSLPILLHIAFATIFVASTA